MERALPGDQKQGIQLGWAARRLSLLIGAGLLLLPAARSRAGNQSGDPRAEFKRLASELSAARLGGAEETQAQQEKALSYLDGIVSTAVNASAPPDLDALNQQLATLVAHDPPLGEDYRVARLGGTPPVYALIANFGLGGPAAVRIYAAAGGRYHLTARLDHFMQKDFFDSDIELVPVSATDFVFVTISGRTDDASTGMFSAWRYDGANINSLWTSDLLTHSAYEAMPNGIALTYCSNPDDEHPRDCSKMVRDEFAWSNGAWKRVARKDLGPAKPAKK